MEIVTWTFAFSGAFLLLLLGEWRKIRIFRFAGMMGITFCLPVIYSFIFLLNGSKEAVGATIIESMIGLVGIYATYLTWQKWGRTNVEEKYRQTAITVAMATLAWWAGTLGFVFRDNLNLLIVWTILGIAGSMFAIGLLVGVIKLGVAVLKNIMVD